MRFVVIGICPLSLGVCVVVFLCLAWLVVVSCCGLLPVASLLSVVRCVLLFASRFSLFFVVAVVDWCGSLFVVSCLVAICVRVVVGCVFLCVNDGHCLVLFVACCVCLTVA